MKRHEENPLTNIGVGVTSLNRGWNKVKSLNLNTVPLTSVSIPTMFKYIIEKNCGSLENFCWYGHKEFNPSKMSNDGHNDVFYGELLRSNPEVKVLYEEQRGIFGDFCSWNPKMNIGFLLIENSKSGYFIRYK